MICGAGGQLGQKLIGAAKAAPQDWRIFAYNRGDLDITRPADLRAALAEARPDLCINAAAYTAVDRAESEPQAAEAVNVEGARRLAAGCYEAGVKFIHFSTDYVYADDYNRPLRENDRTQGGGVYARTKLRGEIEVMRHHPAAYILRTSWVYAEYGHNFVRTMLRLGRERERLNVVCDQIGSPTYAADLAAATLRLAASDAPAGIYNYANAGACSWYDFSCAVFELSGLNCRVDPIPTSERPPTPATRPHYSVLDTRKVAGLVGTPRHWRAALRECIDRVNATDPLSVP